MFDYITYLNFRTPRAKLSSGKIRAIPLVFTDERVSFSYDFERKAILTLVLSVNQSKTAKYLNTSFEVVHNIMDRAVKRGLLRRNLDDVKVFSLDEKSIRNGHNYITIMSDPYDQRILDIIEGRKIDDTQELIQNTLTVSQQKNITEVTMDMWKPYISCISEMLPHADIVHDNFHIAKYLNKGVDNVRKSEVKKHEELKNTKYILLKNSENWTSNQQVKFQEINQINLKTADAWRLKENFKGIYNFWNPKHCIHFFETWYTNVIESDIKQMIDVADTLLRHLKGIVNAAVTTLSNGIAENINSKVQIVKSVGRGFKSVEGYRNALLFFNGKLDLLPT
jgi:transposase